MFLPTQGYVELGRLPVAPNIAPTGNAFGAAVAAGELHLRLSRERSAAVRAECDHECALLLAQTIKATIRRLTAEEQETAKDEADLQSFHNPGKRIHPTPPTFLELCQQRNRLYLRNRYRKKLLECGEFGWVDTGRITPLYRSFKLLHFDIKAQRNICLERPHRLFLYLSRYLKSITMHYTPLTPIFRIPDGHIVLNGQLLCDPGFVGCFDGDAFDDDHHPIGIEYDSDDD